MKRGVTIVCTPLYDTAEHRLVIVDKVLGGIGRGGRHDWQKDEKVWLPIDQIIVEPQVTAFTEVKTAA